MQKFEYCMQLLATPLKCRGDPPGGTTHRLKTCGITFYKLLWTATDDGCCSMTIAAARWAKNVSPITISASLTSPLQPSCEPNNRILGPPRGPQTSMTSRWLTTTDRDGPQLTDRDGPQLTDQAPGGIGRTECTQSARTNSKWKYCAGFFIALINLLRFKREETRFIQFYPSVPEEPTVMPKIIIWKMW